MPYSSDSKSTTPGSIDRHTREVTAHVEERFRTWIDATPDLQHPFVRMVLFSVIAQQLAQDDIGLGLCLKQVLRAFGLEGREIEITSEEGEVLLRDDHRAH